MILVGLNHKTASIEIRELAAFVSSQCGLALAELKKNIFTAGAVIISTCNRVEICCDTEKTNADEIIDFIKKFHNIQINDFGKYFYVFKGIDVFRHLAAVASGLESMVTGETQIFGQIKKAYQYSLENGYSSKRINILFQLINNVVKKIRLDTNICRGAVSVSYAAAELAKKIFDNLDSVKLMLVGAGKMAELCVRDLSKSESVKILITNRSIEKSKQIAKKVNGEIIEFSKMFEAMTGIDIIIVSTRADAYIITEEHIKDLMRRRENELIFIIDISVPRNVSPKINDIENVYLYNIDDLEKVVEENKKNRSNDIAEAEKIIEMQTANAIKKIYGTSNHL